MAKHSAECASANADTTDRRDGGDCHVFQFRLNDVEHRIDVINPLSRRISGVEQTVGDLRRRVGHALNIMPDTGNHRLCIPNDVVRIRDQRTRLDDELCHSIVQLGNTRSNGQQQQHQNDQHGDAEEEYTDLE